MRLSGMDPLVNNLARASSPQAWLTTATVREASMSVSARTSVCALFFCLLILLYPPVARAGENWLPISSDELKMAVEPKAPGAAAVYLYRQVDRDDAAGRERIYARIKIFSEEGRNYADIEIPFRKGSGDITDIQGRTIHPDGSIVNFDGRVFEKTIVKAKGVQYLAKTFTLPGVQPGSIIEYRYTRNLPEEYVYDSNWLLSEELFTKHAKFSLLPNTRFALKMSWQNGLPPGTNPPVNDHHVVRLETQDVPAFQIEDYMPPEDELKYRVDFTYSSSSEMDVDKFWNGEGKRLYGGVEAFTGKQKAMEQAVAQVTLPTDTEEQRLRKIYARCQSLRNLSFEHEKTEQEHSREKLKNIGNVEEVWKRGYGYGQEITWLFLALARAAGFDASPVMVSTRDQHFFNRKMMNSDDLNTNVVLVKLAGQDLYLDPGVAYAPFGLLPWYESGVSGLRFDKDGGTWIVTSLPQTSASGVERMATLKLDDTGSLEGSAVLTFRGLSALWLRIDENEDDSAERKKFLEDEIRAVIPTPAEAELTNSPDWNSSSDTLVAEYHIKIPSWASYAGHRTSLSVGVFAGGEKHVFEHASRVHPIYYHYGYQDQDDVTIELPQDWRVSSLPKPHNIDGKICAYHADIQNTRNFLHLTRQLTINVLMLDPKYYPGLRNFYEQVRAGDDQQIVLSSGVPSAQN